MPDLLDQLHEIRRELMPGPKGPCQTCSRPALRADTCLACRRHALRKALDCSDDEADRLIVRFVQSTRDNLQAIRALLAVQKDGLR